MLPHYLGEHLVMCDVLFQLTDGVPFCIKLT